MKKSIITEEIRAYAEEVAAVVEKYGVSVSVRLVKKNNGIELLVLRFDTPEDSLSVGAYGIEGMYRDGKSVDEAADEIYSQYQAGLAEAPSCLKGGADYIRSSVCDWENAKELVVPYIVSEVRNKDTYSLSKPLVDGMMVIYKVVLEDSDEGRSAVTLSKEVFEGYGITLDTLHEAAVGNLEKKGYQIRNIGQYLAEKGFPDFMIMGMQKDPANLSFVSSGIAPSVGGANVLLQKRALEEYAEKNGGDFYIIPSSTNEVLFARILNTMGPEDLNMMVGSVNEEQVPENEILSDFAYIYRVATGTIEVA